MARYDKIPIGDSFRAPLLEEVDDVADLNKVFAVGLDANGRLVLGAGNSGIKGVTIFEQFVEAGAAHDTMKRGEIVHFADAPLSTPVAPVAGTNYYADPGTGAVSATDTGIYIGHTVEPGRLVVNVDEAGGAA